MNREHAGRRVGRLALGVLAAGLLITGALTAAAFVLYDRNEQRLLDLRVRELGLLLSSSADSSVQTPLASAAALADATNASPNRLRSLLAPYVGPGRQFVSASAWSLATPHPMPVVRFGVAPALDPDTARASAFVAGVRHVQVFRVIGVLRAGSQLRLGYALGTPGASRGYAIYAESALPADRRSRLSANSAFSDLNYALFLGRTRAPAALLVTNLTRLPVTGRQAPETLRFGDRSLTLVVTPRGSLGGTFFQLLPWIIAVVGVVLAIAATMLTDRLIRRRQRAELLAANLDRVAAENQQLYAEQRGIAETLQHALLPEALPDIAGLTTAVRYVPGTSGVEIGGDWYDLIVQREGSALLVVGDVAGRGVRAATTMASLRFAALAYAAEGGDPAGVLAKLARFPDGQGTFATVMCARLDVQAHSVTLASAGHLPPLLVAGGDTAYLPLKVGVPIGAGPAEYETVTVTVPSHATLIAFTDGLIERRGEVIDEGLDRLRRVARTSGASALEDLLTTLVAELPADGRHEDDTAVLAVRWSA